MYLWVLTHTHMQISNLDMWQCQVSMSHVWHHWTLTLWCSACVFYVAWIGPLGICNKPFYLTSFSRWMQRNLALVILFWIMFMTIHFCCMNLIAFHNYLLDEMCSAWIWLCNCTWAHLSNRRIACSTSFFVCSQSNKTWRWNFRRTRLSTQDTKSITEHNKQKGHWNLPVLKSMAEVKCELAVSSANLGERSRKHRFVFRERPKLPVWQMLHLLYVQRTPWLQLQNLQMVTGRSFSLEAMKLLKSDGLRNYNSYNSYNELMWQRLSGSTPGVYLGSSQHLKGRPCRQNASCLKSQLSVGATKGSTRFLLRCP
jgi:hypothetical protein